ncbi:multimeric flavodoxin WrbA [Mycoplana sp. BE70]|uniref:flavodoxin family protein n=1 Tax=Mycoplana sp. BE70 TaxID=2817775 RepID=UPI00285CD052|nr:flavodoxin family protein [Mycoplana sp. BE70]MDR6758682.1 multimeric flavodoxin WrbA [Mycoplana sp. BE70]
MPPSENAPQFDPILTPRKGMPSPRLDEAEFRSRYRQLFEDPAFEHLKSEIDSVTDAAWDAYKNSRKSPYTRKAGPGYDDPEYDLSVDWIAAKDAIDEAQKRHDDKSILPRVLLINGSSRSEHTCPGEESKSYRMVEIARSAIEAVGGVDVDVLSLERLASEYGRHIHPCKACFSTSPALCHWPCSCYPNHSLGQVQDWMNDIYPLWVGAHGIMIVTPVNWYSPSSPVKLMMDRLVCADGGNPDPSRTQGKDAALAKIIEMQGWDYPRHLAGRLFSVVVHGDTEGAENTRRDLADWLRSMELESAGALAEIDRYIGYWKEYAKGHADFDQDRAIQAEVRNAALTLRDAVLAKRAGKMIVAGTDVDQPRKK